MNTYEVVVERVSKETFEVIANNEEDAKKNFVDGPVVKAYIGMCIEQKSVSQKPISVALKKEGNDYGY